jgi:hypothetical protein
MIPSARSRRRQRKNSGEKIEIGPERVCRRGTAPITYEKEARSFGFDKWAVLRAHRPRRRRQELIVEPAEARLASPASTTARTPSATTTTISRTPGSVVKAMASAKDAYPHVVALFRHHLAALDPTEQHRRERSAAPVRAARRDLLAVVDDVPG